MEKHYLGDKNITNAERDEYPYYYTDSQILMERRVKDANTLIEMRVEYDKGKDESQNSDNSIEDLIKRIISECEIDYDEKKYVKPKPDKKNISEDEYNELRNSIDQLNSEFKNFRNNFKGESYSSMTNDICIRRLKKILNSSLTIINKMHVEDKPSIPIL